MARVYGIAEIAEALNVRRQTVWAWVQRGTHGIPEPDQRLAMGPVWRAETIEPWIRKMDRIMVVKGWLPGDQGAHFFIRDYDEEIAENQGRRDAECYICSAAGMEVPATRRVLGRDACDQCASELEAALQIGPAIWLVSVADSEELQAALRVRPAIWMVDGSEADFGTVDYGSHGFGWYDREAAEAYAQRVGAEVREGFLVEVIGGDEGDVLEAAGLTDWARFDGPVVVVWPHDDEDGLRRRLLYGANA